MAGPDPAVAAVRYAVRQAIRPLSGASPGSGRPPLVLVACSGGADSLALASGLAFEAPRAGLLIAGFEVDHLHIHVMPAWGEAQLSFANAATSVPADELQANTERIRAALTELGYAEDIPADIHSAG